MTDSISAVSANSVSKSSSSSSTALTDATKKKLEALGINTTDIKTESDGQEKLKEAQAAQNAQNAKPAQQAQSNTVETEAKDLASQMGVVVGNNDDLATILDSISAQISNVQASAGTDETKKSEADNYQIQYNTIYQEYQQQEASKSMLTGSLDGMAAYNKAALGL